MLKGFHITWAALAIVIICLAAPAPLRAVCNVGTSSLLAESFSTDNYYDGSASTIQGWSTGSGKVQLNGKGAKFALALGENYTGTIYTMVGGDFNMDSRCLDDFVMVSRNQAGTCQLVFGRNKGGSSHEGFEVSTTALASLDSSICSRDAAPLVLSGKLNNDSFF